MSFRNDKSRRDFLKLSGLGLLTSFLDPRLILAQEVRHPRRQNAAFKPDVEIALDARPSLVQILPGSKTRVWKYEARVLNGDARSVESIAESHVGPIFRLEKGQKVRVLFKNELPEACVTHWHGLHVPSDMDGHPMDAVNTGETLVYEFELRNRAGTYWFHPHTHELTATQVYQGLAGLFIVADDHEKALNLPRGEFDVPLVLQDRSFDSENQFRYLSHPMQSMHGFLGDRILVNGKPDFVLEAAARSYRLRILNGSNSRIYKLAWQDGAPLTVIGTDGGLLEKAVMREFVMLAPGERIELWADFGGREIGSEMILRSLPFDAPRHAMQGEMGHSRQRHGMMGHGMMGRGMMDGMQQSELSPGGEYPLMKVRIVRKTEEDSELPDHLSSIARLRVESAANRENPRTIGLSMTHHVPRLNGRSYEMDHVLTTERIPLNTLQLIEFRHSPMGGMGMMGMMDMPHPIHLHGQQFQILDRSIEAAYERAYDTVRAGFVDSGWKDTVLVMPGESVRILKPFEDFAGRFMIHCHNLEHEDAGMMRDFLVESGTRS